MRWVSLCLCSLAYLKTLSGAVTRFFSADSEICTYDDDVMFSHNGAYGVWHWQYVHECSAGTSSHRSPMYFSGGTTLVAMYTLAANYASGVLMMIMWGIAFGWSTAACGIIKVWAKFALYVCCVCYCFYWVVRFVFVYEIMTCFVTCFGVGLCKFLILNCCHILFQKIKMKMIVITVSRPFLPTGVA